MLKDTNLQSTQRKHNIEAINHLKAVRHYTIIKSKSSCYSMLSSNIPIKDNDTVWLYSCLFFNSVLQFGISLLGEGRTILFFAIHALAADTKSKQKNHTILTHIIILQII